jgi:hypothetical protein
MAKDFKRVPAFPIEGLSNLGIQFSFTNALDLWPVELGIPGFIGGLFFAALLAITGQLRRFELLSAGRLTACGALAGLLLAGFLIWRLWPEPAHAIAWICGIATALGAIAGPGSALVFRFVARKLAP